MDRQGISSPVFDNNDGVNNYITKASIFDLQRQMQGAQSTLRERLDNLAIDIHHSEARKRDYIDTKLGKLKDQLRDMVADYKSSSPSSSSRRRRASRSSSERPRDASASRPRPHLHGDHHHVRDQHRHEGQVTSKQRVHDDDERHLLRAQARQRHHHHQEREGQELYTNNRSTTSPSPLASSPSDFKASSPSDIRHLRQQAPQDYAQEKLPKLKSATSTSYYDLDTDHEIPFWDSRSRGVSRVGAFDGQLPQATSSSSQRSSKVRHKEVP